MASKLELIECEINNLIDNEQEYNLCLFLTKLREATGWNRKQIARDVGVDYAKYTYWESGEFYARRHLNDAEIARIAEYFGAPTEILLKKRDQCIRLQDEFNF